MDDKEPLAMYLDWSDKGFEKYQAGQGGAYAVISVWTDEEGTWINLRRDSKCKQDFAILLPDKIVEELRSHDS